MKFPKTSSARQILMRRCVKHLGGPTKAAAMTDICEKTLANRLRAASPMGLWGLLDACGASVTIELPEGM